MSSLSRSITRTTIVILTVIAGIAISIGYVISQIAKAPPNNLQQFLKLGGRGSLGAKQRLVVCVGASIVQGRVSPDFVEMLAKQFPNQGFTFVNAGVNGDTSFHLRQRLDQVVASDPDYITILLGTNDILCTLIPGQWRMYRGNKRLTAQPTLESYAANLREIIRCFHDKTKARIGICSLPLLGEDLDGMGNTRVREFNAAIKQICEEEQASYLPVFEQEAAYLAEQQQHHPQVQPFRVVEKDIVRYSFAGTLRHYLLGQSWDHIGHSRGMLVKTDMVHGNTVEAEIISANIAAFLGLVSPKKD